ncbi:unnamed protein product [Closterium sp. Naga37s-1]|nr:unnamed protein product [Closterium sp. Naga37s-1]
MAVDSRLITSHGATEHSAEPALLPTTSTFFSSNKSADSSSSPSSSYSSHGSTAKAYQEVPIYRATDAAPLPEAPSPSFSPFRTAPYSDRFIPSRSSSLAFSFPLLDRPGDPPQTSHGFGAGPEGREDSAAAYSLLLKSQLLGGQLSASPALGSSSAQESDCVLGRPCRVPLFSSATSPYSSSSSPLAPKNLFRYINGASSAGGAADHGGGSGLDSPLSLSPIGLDAALCGLPFSPKKAPRKIARSPFKVLDAPALQDDFYLNLVDWSSTNVLAVGLGSCVYLWSAASSKVTKLVDVGPSDAVCSVSWTQRGTLLAVGTNNGHVQVWDVVKGRRVRSMGGHRVRVGAMAWAANVLATGSRDRSVLQRDVRAPVDYVARLTAHRSEVCGLKWSPDDRELASGGNDNQLLIWSVLTSQQPVVRFTQHQAAVKAIAWSPHQHGLLASGGGTADRCIRFWNTATATPLSWVDTGSQVCNLLWSRNANELASTHGYSQNQVVVWKYPSMAKLATLTGHTMRVLFLAVSPDGQTIVTGAGDETLRFWNVFPGTKSQQLPVQGDESWHLNASDMHRQPHSRASLPDSTISPHLSLHLSAPPSIPH